MIEISARRGKAVRVRKGQRIKVINTKGQQVVDTWAFNADNLHELMSMEHSRVAIGHIIPAIGDALVTNRRRPILTLVEDTSGGIHDTSSPPATAGATSSSAARSIMTTAPTTSRRDWQRSGCRRRKRRHH